MPERFALRITEEILSLVEHMTGNRPVEFDEMPYLVITPNDEWTEFNMKMMTEDTMFAEFKNDSQLHVMN